MEYQSIHELFEATCAKNRDRVAYSSKKDGQWHDLTWAETRTRVRDVAKSLIELGIKKGERVCILSDTRLEWTLCDFGITTVGSVTVGIYPSNLGPDCAYIINHCDAELIIVENSDQLEKILSVRAEIPAIRNIVVIDGPSDPGNNVMSWDEFLERGRDVDDRRYEERASSVKLDDLASLVYTSGTTGVPKGVMITNGNLVFISWCASQCLYIKPEFTALLFLPLAHVFARLIVYTCMRTAIPLVFAEGFAKVAENLKEVRPHFVPSVPRIFEKVHGKITTGVKEAGGLKQKLFDWAIEIGMRAARIRDGGGTLPVLLRLQHALADRLVLHKIRDAFGGRLVYAISGAAPLNKDIAEFFNACGVLILEGIGMTENTSFSGVNPYHKNKFGTVGPAGPRVEMKLAPDGEVLFRGPNVMKGYFKNDLATAETIDEDGWLHSGDIGEIDEDGYLKITDRKKDLIVTAGGKNVAPQRIERVLRTSQYISQVVAIGDKRQFISALITLDGENVTKWANQNGVAFDGVEDLARDPKVNTLIEGEVEARNAELASYESVKKFKIVPWEFSIEGGELTPTLKVKRKTVVEKYGSIIEEMYRV